MKRFFILLALFIPHLLQAQFEMRMNYMFNTPQNTMRMSLNNAHGFGVDYLGSVKKSNYYVGLSFQLGIYGYHTAPIKFTDMDGNEINTNLNITNSYNTWSILHKYRFSQFESKGGRLVPFVEARTGWSFFRTGLYIEDPEDVTNCEPLEKDVMQKDNNWNLYGGAGFDFLLNGLFHPEKSENTNNARTYFSISFGFNYGGKVEYMNVNKDESISAQQNSNGNTSSDSKPFYTNWINTQTQVTHQHHTGYLYTSPIRLMELKAGFTFRF